jgi:hypothetical protein
MNRTAKLAGQWVLVAAIACASAWMGARVATVKMAGTPQVHSGIVLVDGGPKPCPNC